jgi:formamidopyrimidine-DNA glycosylase
MSELPELKIIRRSIARHATYKKIVGFSVFKLKLKGGSLKDLNKKVLKSSFKEADLWGKSIVLRLMSGYYVWVNMQTTGFFVYQNKRQLEKLKYIRAEFNFANGSRLLFIDPRGHSYFKLLNDKQLKQSFLKVGVDPLGKKFNYQALLDLIRGRRTSVKNFLTNDRVFLGIGSIYADEICFAARIRPDKSVKLLKKNEIRRLYSSIGIILKKSIEYGGLTKYLLINPGKLRFDRFLRIYNRAGEKCYRCGSKRIIKKKIGGVNSFYCSGCQN